MTFSQFSVLANTLQKNKGVGRQRGYSQPPSLLTMGYVWLGGWLLYEGGLNPPDPPPGKYSPVITIKNLTYKDRLKRLKLPTLKYRRIRSDMIEVYKILTNKIDSRVNFYLEKQQDSITRGHSLKSVNNRYHYTVIIRLS